MKTGPDLLDAMVPYLLLQPLVENAIRHGIAPLAAPGRVDIRIERDASGLRIEISNDGRASSVVEGSGIGLANVAGRLRHLYGEAQQVDAGWRDDGRFHVCVSLPLRVPPRPVAETIPEGEAA
jgi:two-component system sensor histidine kinase AlgZ